MVYGLLLVAAASRLRPRSIVEGRCRDCGRLIRLERRSQPLFDGSNKLVMCSQCVQQRAPGLALKGGQSSRGELFCGLGVVLPSSVSLNGNGSG